MTQAKEAAFSDRVLFVAESAQYVLHRSRIGRALVRQFTGSESEHYEQLLWLPPWKIYETNIKTVVPVLGDPRAEKSATGWERIAVIAAKKVSLDGLKLDPYAQEAIAYRSQKAWHIGVSAVRGAAILEPISRGRLAIGMRQGPGDVEFALGTYSYKSGNFTSVETGALELVEASVPQRHMPHEHPGVKIG